MPAKASFTLQPLALNGKETIGKRIASLRKRKGLTQAELAEKIGITRKLVSDYETDRTHLNDEMVIRFSIALSVSSDMLLGLKNSEITKERHISLRIMRRMKEISGLPEKKKKAILRTLDDLIRANS